VENLQDFKPLVRILPQAIRYPRQVVLSVQTFCLSVGLRLQAGRDGMYAELACDSCVGIMRMEQG
jgi:hypothetical protein